MLATGVVALLASALLTGFRGVPEPQITDEFSYLLAADTFARGRLSNPPHPHWRHFQAAHVLQQPTYASKYPPAQGVFLAIGKLIGGHAIVGVWISAALSCAAICWMLLACLPPRWALLGAGLAVLRIVLVGGGGAPNFGVDGYWSQSYWGGAPAALGGALLFGGSCRIVAGRGAPGAALAFALGAVLLFNSRPYEGTVLAVVAAIAIARFAITAPSLGGLARRVAVPAALVIALGAAATCFYNDRVTGDPLKLPYQLYDESYAMVSQFSWLPVPPEISYDDAGLRQARWADQYLRQRQRTVSGFLTSLPEKGTVFARFYLGHVLAALCLLTLPWVLRDRRIRFAVVALGFLAVALLAVTFFLPHYAAPGAALVFLVEVQSLRHLRAWRPRRYRRVGRLLFRFALCACVALALYGVASSPPERPPGFDVRLGARITARPGKHLAIIRRDPTEIGVGRLRNYNGAEIDEARVVWADDLGVEENRRLRAYFHDRRGWRVELGQERGRIAPLPTLPR